MTEAEDLVMDEVMTPNPIAIDIDASVNEAKNLMNRLGVRHMPVTENGVIESIVNYRDLYRFYSPRASKDEPDQILLRDLCAGKIHTADVNDKLGKVLKTMIRKHIEAVILLRDGEMAGIFTESDACRILAKHLGYSL